MITFQQAMSAMDAPQITEINTDALDNSDVLNLILQRSEIIRDQENYNRYIRAWTRGNDAPILELIGVMGRDTLIRRAAAFIYLEFEQLRHIFDDKAPKKIADIGCGYALFDLFLAKEYDSKLALIDIESNDNRHFGFKDSGAAYSSLANASKFLAANGVKKSAIKTFNPEADDLSKLSKLDYAFSFISCGFHYPWSTYEDFFKHNVAPDGRIILDIRSHKLGDHVREMSGMGFVRSVVMAANNTADRIMIVKSLKAA
ncbi:class I SAM-dependent methyltransferase [Planktotalea arctica]|uniref:class I SAM-dependent methyltransferase n=1 Tax=Planktotalea arctica TaxID=1481893 RepID=UPI00321A1FE3